MIEVKKGVAFAVLHPAIKHALDVVSEVWAAVPGAGRPVVTSFQDSRHSATSLHYGKVGDVRCRALDLRTWPTVIPSDMLQPTVEVLQEHLGPDYDVVLETDHIHVEYDP